MNISKKSSVLCLIILIFLWEFSCKFRRKDLTDAKLNFSSSAVFISNIFKISIIKRLRRCPSFGQKGSFARLFFKRFPKNFSI